MAEITTLLSTVNRAALLIQEEPVDDIFKCNICLDFLLKPVQCRGGHNFCTHCISSLVNSQCPTCRVKMDRHAPIQNRAIQQLIEKFTCRCPTTNSCSSASAASATSTSAVPMGGKSPKNKRARVTYHGSSSSSSSSSVSSTYTPGEELCSWTGSFGSLEDHLSQCDHVETSCAFKQFGCNVKLNRTAMEAHQVSHAQVHSIMMADKIIKLEAKVSAFDEKIEQSTTAQRLRLDRLTTKVDTLINSGSTCFRWPIDEVRAKVAQKTQVLSKVFKVAVPGRGTYVLQLSARFGYTPEGQKEPAEGKVLGLFVNHVCQSGHCSILPIDLDGSSFHLEADGNDHVDLEMDNTHLITEAGNGWGYPSFCADVSALDVNSLVIHGKIQINCVVNNNEEITI